MDHVHVERSARVIPNWDLLGKTRSRIDRGNERIERVHEKARARITVHDRYESRFGTYRRSLIRRVPIACRPWEFLETCTVQVYFVDEATMNENL